MKVLSSLIPPILAATCCAIATDAAKVSAFHPLQLSLGQLVNQQEFDLIREDFLNALSQDGLFTIRDIPDLHKQSVLEAMQPCINKAKATQEHTLRDGTRRRTLATHTSPGGRTAEGIRKPSVPSDDQVHCQGFVDASERFRAAAGVATNAFASRLASVLRTVEDGRPADAEAGDRRRRRPLLATRDGHAFEDFLDVVKNGDHLEHFHSYHTPVSPSSSSNFGKTTDDTIEWHVDQGLFIVFTPGTLVREDPSSAAGSTIQGLTDGFYVRLSDGSTVEVEFSNEDDLVILLGDGFNQYINPHYQDTDAPLLRAAPHALSMIPHQADESRVWYGRMVLPPVMAIHPVHDETFGRLRDMVVDKDTPEDEVIAVACSSSAQARELQTTTCEAGTLLCWHDCMSLEEHGVSEDICTQQGLDLWCINPRGQLWDNTHGDFFPGCIDASKAENATEFPRLPNYPRDNVTACTAETFQRFLQDNQESAYDHSVDLDGVAVFEWTVLENNVIRGRLAYDGLFGYLALGIPSVGGGKNGMHGAEIIMAIPGGNYDAAVGFDLTIPPSINEYVIDPEKSSFRFWDTPVSIGTNVSESSARNTMGDGYAIAYDDCFTAITFESTGFHGKPFNVSGSDHFIWAANDEDYFAAYHTQRGHIYVNWLSGEASDHHDHDHADDGGHEEEEPTTVEPPVSAPVASSSFVATTTGANAFAFGLILLLLIHL
ncbi:hypothetical protein FisN_16Hu289 [Fistulifera solaris]|jgi:hypothetical protein|uniref:VWFD domain-containing protein n=1 Tax=Fistulifera solaris TaxID=1519565 RepID=A0A1Z5KTG7_FISSO|nr:hypothetical protein FisN_16Hu289 [Fistulifera solaris]|eukprot:GAX29281.1 hypothetical protein FisN_16Hu289 [Fistulifera solaris]